MNQEDLMNLLDNVSSELNTVIKCYRHGKKIDNPKEKELLSEVLVRLSSSYGTIYSMIDDLEIIKELHRKKPVVDDDETTIFYCSTEVMYRTRDVMNHQDRLEDLCFVAGFMLPGTNIIVPTVPLKPKMAHRKVASARAEPLSVYRNYKYINLFELVWALLAHSHPGKGPKAINPSSIDIETYSVWEEDSYLIGVIFDEIGQYFRFFTATDKEFVIEMIGGGVKHVGGNTYCFTE